MVTITRQQADKYIEEGGSRCPACGSHNVDGHSVEIDTGGATQVVDCIDCQADWVDCYTLTGILVNDCTTTIVDPVQAVCEAMVEALQHASRSEHHPACPNDGTHCTCHVAKAQHALTLADKARLILT